MRLSRERIGASGNTDVDGARRAIGPGLRPGLRRSNHAGITVRCRQNGGQIKSESRSDKTRTAVKCGQILQPPMSCTIPGHRRAHRQPNSAGRVSRFDATGRKPVDKWTAAPRLTTSPQANHNNRSGQLIWYINRSTHNVLDSCKNKSVSFQGSDSNLVSAGVLEAGKERGSRAASSLHSKHDLRGRPAPLWRRLCSASLPAWLETEYRINI